MRVIFLGTPRMAVPTLRLLAESGDCKPLAVFTQPAARRSRRGAAQPSAVGLAAAELGLECHEIENVSAAEPFARMQELTPDVIVVVAFGQLLRKAVLALPKHGCINLHPSLLPKYRGAAPVQRAIMDGVVESGLTIMRLVKKMDAGPILLQKQWRMNPDKYAVDLLEEAGELGSHMMLGVLRRLESGISATSQDEADATYAPPLQKADGEIHFARPATELHNRIRAVKAWPKAEAWLEREPPVRVIVQRASVQTRNHAPGNIVSIDGDGILVACGEGSLLLEEVQLEDKPSRPARDVANGLRLKPGERFRT
jgi:methionyl-tRNA formyltransferase